MRQPSRADINDVLEHMLSSDHAQFAKLYDAYVKTPADCQILLNHVEKVTGLTREDMIELIEEFIKKHTH